jgi:hypothetical protein
VGSTDDAGWMAGLDGVLDLDQVLHFMAAESALGHADGYTWANNNYFLHSTDKGRFTMLPWGLDQAFTDELVLPGGKSLLATRCAALDACAAAFASAAADVLAVLASDDWAAEVDRLDELIRPFCEDEPLHPWTLQEHDDAVTAAKAFLRKRAEQDP